MKNPAAAAATLAVIVCICACTRTDSSPSGPHPKITIAYSATTDSVLAEVAYVRGYFSEEGLEVNVRKHPYGKLALQDVLEGKADFATVAETPVMFAIMGGEKISVITTIESSRSGNAIIARKDRGVRTLEDLRGKSIGVTSGTTSDFYCDALMATYGILRNSVKILNIKAEKISEALADGDIDAASTFSPYTIQAQRKLGDLAVALKDENVYTWTFNVVAKQDFIRNNPAVVKKLLRALVKAEEFIMRHEAEAQKIVSDFGGIDAAIVRDIWDKTTFGVSLDQSLLLALEDESRWAITNKLTSAAKVPNYMDFIYTDGLLSVKPAAMKILR